MTIEAKTCKNCGLTKDLSAFRKDSNNKTDGRRGTCKTCDALKKRGHAAEGSAPTALEVTKSRDEEGAVAPSASDWETLRDIVGEPPPREDSEEPAVTEEELNQLLRSNPLAGLTSEQLQEIANGLPVPTEADLKRFEKGLTKERGARPSRERFNMRWNPDEIQELEQFSEKQDLSMSQTVRRAVRYYMAEVERLGYLP